MMGKLVWKSNLVFWTILILFINAICNSPVFGNDTEINALAGDFEAAFQGKCGPSSPCVQLCVELHDGTFECQCRPGYRLLLDGYSCVELSNSTYSDDEDSEELESDLEYNSNPNSKANLLKQTREESLTRLRAAQAAAAAAVAAEKHQQQISSSFSGLEGRPLPRPIASSSQLSNKASKEAQSSALQAARAAEAQERNNYLKKFAPIDGSDADLLGLRMDGDSATTTQASKRGIMVDDKKRKSKLSDFGRKSNKKIENYYDSRDEDDDSDDDEDDEGSTNEAEEDLASLELDRTLPTKSANGAGTHVVKDVLGGGEEDDDASESDEDFILPPRALPSKEISLSKLVDASVAPILESTASPSSTRIQLDESSAEENAPPAPSSPVKSPPPATADTVSMDCPLKCNRGICSKEGWDDMSSNMGYRCLCPMGTKGTFCEIEEIFEEGGGYTSGLFRGKSWVAFPELHDAYMSDQISLEFRPQSPNGIILLTGERDDLSGDYLALFLKDGFLEFRFDCGSGSGMVRSSSPVILQQWNKASIVRRRWDGWMQLNDSPFTQGRSKGLFSRITFRQPVYIGGQGNITFNSVSTIQSNFDEEPELASSSTTSSSQGNPNTAQPQSQESTPINTPPSLQQTNSGNTDDSRRASILGSLSPGAIKEAEQEKEEQGSSTSISSMGFGNSQSSSVVLLVKNDVEQQQQESSSTVTILKGIGGFQGCIRNLVINDRVYRFGIEPAGDSLQGFDIENCNDQGMCDLVKCQHGGQCLVQKEENPTCLCPLGFSGPLCETPLDLQIPSFNGSSYLKYGGLGQTRVLSWLELEIVIKPDGMDGLVMYNGYKTDGMGDFISLVIDQGYIEFAMDLGTGTAIIRSDLPVALGEWHHIHVSRTSRLISLRIDNQPPLMALTPGAFTQLSLPHNLFLGGIPDPQWLSPKVKVQGGFTGCIQKLVINEKPLRIMGSAMSGVNLENCEHPCLRNPCDHGGDCIPQLDTFKCHCPLGFRDPYCQTRMDKTDVITAPKFIGDSYLRFTHPRIIKRLSGWRLNLSFRLKTDSSRGLLAWAGRKWMTSASDFISVGLRNGFITASFSLGSGQITIAYNYTSVNDGRWHHVHLIRNEQEASLSIDDGPPISGMAPGKLRQLNINDGLYIGGLEEARHQSMNRYTEGFVGCLTDLVLGSERVSLLQEASEGRNVDYCD